MKKFYFIINYLIFFFKLFKKQIEIDLIIYNFFYKNIKNTKILKLNMDNKRQIGTSSKISFLILLILFVDLFDKGLKNIIDSFERAREWADLSNCL